MTSQFNSEKVLAKINEIENTFPVNDWNINGLRIWPYLRTALAYTQNRNPDVRKSSSAKNVTSRIAKIRKYSKIVLRLPLEYIRLKKRLRTATRIFLGAVTHRTSINGLLFNRYYDLAIDDFARRGEDCIAMDNSFLEVKSKYYNQSSLFSLPGLFLVAEIKRRFSLQRPVYTINLPEYDAFFEHALQVFEHTGAIRTAFSKASVARRVKVLHYRTEFLKKILKDSACQKVYFLCYYSSLFYPVIAACNALNITTTDIQHGGMGEGHYSYGRWSKSPSEGYELLPRFFWTWDVYSAEMINAWAAHTNFHRAIACGNPWADASMRMYKNKPEWNDYVLLNMTNVTLDPFMLETIKHFGANRKWVLRMHPRQYRHHKVLQKQVEDEKIQDLVKIEDSGEVPLQVSLKYCKYFVSKASGSVIEAIEAGKRPVLLRSEIMSYYEHYIKNGMVVVLENDNTPNLIRELEKEPQVLAIVADPTSSEGRFQKFEKEVSQILT